MKALNLDSDSGKTSPDFDPEWELTSWKMRVEQDIKELKEKVLRLERGDTRNLSAASLEIKQTSLRTQETHNNGLFCVRLIKSKPISSAQFILLFICIISFSIFGLLEFLRAKDNDEAEWNPEKKSSTVNYAHPAMLGKYEIPYIFFYFRIVLDDYVGDEEISDDFWTEERMNNTVSHIRNKQSWFEDNKVLVKYMNEDFILKTGFIYYEEVVCQWLYTETSLYETSFGGYFRLKLSAPQKEGMLGLSIPFSGFNQTLNETTIGFEGVYVGISRDEDQANFAELVSLPVDKTFTSNEVLIYDIDYTEKVIKTLESGEPSYYIETAFGGQDTEDLNVSEYGIMMLRISTSLLVEVWKQYIEYGYTDWMTAMGGMLSIVSVVFFWGAYFLALIFGDHKDMGILPKISMVFSNYEDIMSMKDQQKNGIIVNDAI